MHLDTRHVVELAKALSSDSGKIEQLFDRLSKSDLSHIQSAGKPQISANNAIRGDVLNSPSVDALLHYWQSQSDNNVTDQIALTSTGQVLSVDLTRPDDFGLQEGSDIWEMALDAETRNLLRTGLANIARGHEEPLCVLSLFTRDAHRTLWSLSGVHEPGDKAPYARLVRIEFEWSEDAGQTLATTFGFTQAETQVLKALVKGLSLSQLAESRNRSIGTIRSQLKSLLGKSGVNSQLDLLRLYAAVALIGPHVERDAKTRAALKRPGGSIALTLPDGRNLQVDMLGPYDGRPVLYLHNLFFGLVVTDELETALRTHGVRLICPWRAGYAESSPCPAADEDPVSSHLNDIEFLLDTLGIRKTIALGHVSGSVYAAAAARLDRVTSAIAVAGMPPFADRRSFNFLPPWPRLFAFSSRYFPTVLSVIIRGSVNYLLADDPKKLFDHLYGTSKTDRDFLKTKGEAHFFADFGRAFAQGTGAYERDSFLSASNWSTHLEALQQESILFLHGEKDTLNPIELIEHAAQKFPPIELRELAGAGQLALHQSPDEIMRIIVQKYDFAPNL